MCATLEFEEFAGLSLKSLLVWEVAKPCKEYRRYSVVICFFTLVRKI
jgi:hypothetical protein